MAHITIAKIIKSHMGFRLTYLHLTLVRSKSQGEGHAHFDSEYLANSKGFDNITNTVKYGLSMYIHLHLTLTHFNGQTKAMHISTANIL